MKLKEPVQVAHSMGEAVVMDLTTGSLFAGNPSAGVILSHLKEDIGVEELVEAVARDAGTDREQVAADVAAFCDELRRLELLES